MPPWIGQGMCAGVRDAANLCWKLAAVINGQAPDSLLDSYQAERKPHVTEVTRRACRTGWIITQRNRAIAVARNHVLRTLTRVPGVDERLQKITWIPNARYRDGFFAAGGHPAVGWQIPQPWVRDADGARVRLDDVLGRQWAIVHIGEPPSGSQAWAKLDVPTIRVSEPALSQWLRDRKATAAVLRPDGFIYAAAGSGEPLPPPPPGHTGNALTTPRKTGASA
jgi:3-(3-hydroxy-phenyl)propionate hydroxylase